MKLSAIIVLCCSVLLVSATKNSLAIEPTSSTVAPSPSNSTTVAPTPSSNSTTVAPTPSSNSTTVAPSPPSNSTTVAPTPPSNSTTVAPTPPSNSTTTSTTTTTTTTTPPAPTPSPTPPGPVPKPTTGNWILNTTNETCIVIEMATKFDVTYLTTDNKTFTQQINLPSDNTTQVSGNCSGKSEQVMTISWMNNTNNMTIHFINDGKTYSLHHIEAVISNVNLPNINSNYSMNLTGEGGYKAHTGNSYKCTRERDIKMKTNLNETTAHIKISNLQFQAFKTDKSTNFSSADDCSDVTNIVPIAVGCVLIALVVLVLAAYLIGRRNSQARGYVSM